MIFISGIYANFAVLESLVDLTDAPLTVSNLMTNQSQLLLGILGFIIMVLFDALLVWTIYRLFEKVDKRLSQISALFRLVNVIFFAIALVKLMLAYQQIDLINETGMGLTKLNEDQIFKLVMGFNQIWIIGLIFFGIHLALVGLLIKKSAIFPGWIGILLFIAATGYLVDSFANLFLPQVVKRIPVGTSSFIRKLSNTW